MTNYKISLTFTESLLGTVPKSHKLYTDHVASKAEELSDGDLKQELGTVTDIEERGWTGFHEKDGQPILYDYVIKGFFKDACGMLRRADGTLSAKLRAYKKVIDGLVFVEPRQIRLELPAGIKCGTLERPLRISGPQGERTALAKSDTCPAGTRMSFTVTVLGEVSEDLLIEWLDYGALRGLGQWRNAGYGRFSYAISRARQSDAPLSKSMA